MMYLFLKIKIKNNFEKFYRKIKKRKIKKKNILLEIILLKLYQNSFNNIYY